MKSTTKKTSPSPKTGSGDMIRLRAWKLDSANTNDGTRGGSPNAAEAPRIQLDTMESGLNMSQYDSWFSSDRVVSGGMNGTPRTPSGARTPVVHKAASINGISSRSVSDAMGRSPSPSPIPEELMSPTYQNPSAKGSEKTSRFIAQLQEKLTRMSREVAFHDATAKELEKQNQLLRTQVDDVRSRLSTLEQVHEADVHSLDNQDRKIKRLKAEVEEEKARRIKAESAGQIALVNAAETVQSSHREVARAQEEAKYATTSYETLQKSFDKERKRHLEEEKQANEDLQALTEAFRDRVEHIRKTERKRSLDLEKLDAVIAAKDEIIKECEARSRKQNDVFEEYRKQRDEDVTNMRVLAQRKMDETEAVLESLNEIRGKMKWVIAVKRDVKGAG